MPIIGTTRAQIAADLLARWTANMVAAGYPAFDASNTPEGEAIATALAVDLEAHQSNAQALGDEIIPASASDETLARHVAVEAITPRGATFGAWNITVSGRTGGASGTQISSVGRKLVSKTGRTYSPPSSFVMPNGSTTVITTVVADESGTASNLNVGDVLTWTSAPAGIDSTTTVSSAGAAANDAETRDETLARVVAWRRGRPASGSPPDWCVRAEDTSAVYRAYCYPCLKPRAGAYNNADLDTPGCVTMIVLGPPQGDSTASNVIIGGQGAEPPAVRGYFLGTYNADGTPTYGGPQQFAGTMDPADVLIETPVLVNIAIDVSVTLDGKSAFPWAGTMAVDAASTTTSLVVAGNKTANNGLRALIPVGTGAIRGGYQLVTLPAGTYNGGTNKTTWEMSQSPLNAIPAGTCYPAPGNWEAFRAAIFEFFDDLGPGDVPDAITVAPAAGYTRRRRYPPESYVGTPDVYLTRLTAVMLGVRGVINVVIHTPAADQIAAPKQLFNLTTLLAH